MYFIQLKDGTFAVRCSYCRTAMLSAATKEKLIEDAPAQKWEITDDYPYCICPACHKLPEGMSPWERGHIAFEESHTQIWSTWRGAESNLTPEQAEEVAKARQCLKESEDLEGYCPSERSKAMYRYKDIQRPGYYLGVVSEHYGIGAATLYACKPNCTCLPEGAIYLKEEAL